MFFIAYTFKEQVQDEYILYVTGPVGQMQYWNIFIPCSGHHFVQWNNVWTIFVECILENTCFKTF